MGKVVIGTPARLALTVAVGVACVGLDARLPQLAAHPWGACYLFVVVARTATGVWGGVGALLVSLYFTALFSARTPAVPIEAALFIAASLIGLLREWQLTRGKDA